MSKSQHYVRFMTERELTILQCNVHRLKSNLKSLKIIINIYFPNIMLLNETCLHKQFTVYLKNYLVSNIIVNKCIWTINPEIGINGHIATMCLFNVQKIK